MSRRPVGQAGWRAGHLVPVADRLEHPPLGPDTPFLARAAPTPLRRARPSAATACRAPAAATLSSVASSPLTLAYARRVGAIDVDRRDGQAELERNLASRVPSLLEPLDLPHPLSSRAAARPSLDRHAHCLTAVDGPPRNHAGLTESCRSRPSHSARSLRVVTNACTERTSSDLADARRAVLDRVDALPDRATATTTSPPVSPPWLMDIKHARHPAHRHSKRSSQVADASPAQGSRRFASRTPREHERAHSPPMAETLLVARLVRVAPCFCPHGGARRHGSHPEIALKS